MSVTTHGVEEFCEEGVIDTMKWSMESKSVISLQWNHAGLTVLIKENALIILIIEALSGKRLKIYDILVRLLLFLIQKICFERMNDKLIHRISAIPIICQLRPHHKASQNTQKIIIPHIFFMMFFIDPEIIARALIKRVHNQALQSRLSSTTLFHVSNEVHKK